MTKRTRRLLGHAFWYVVLSVIGLVMVVPFLWMLSTSLSSLDRVFHNQWLPIPPQWDNYARAWTAVPFEYFFKYSTIVALAHTAGQVVTSALAGAAPTRAAPASAPNAVRNASADLTDVRTVASDLPAAKRF